MPALSYRAGLAQHDNGWPKHDLLGYRVGPVWHNKIGSVLSRSDSMIITLDRDLSATISELTNETSFIFLVVSYSLLNFFYLIFLIELSCRHGPGIIRPDMPDKITGPCLYGMISPGSGMVLSC